MNGVVCAVCYEDVRPGCEELQAVAGCGHVFHELCFQQWLEYCHRKPSCPVCKRTCTKNDVHRLFFLSSGELTQPTQSNSRASTYNEASLRVNIQKLEAQLSVANLGLQSGKQQLKELDEQLSTYKTRLEKAESQRRDAISERDRYKETSSRIQEDLNKCLKERSTLLEKNTSLAKELASMKLVADIDLNEDEILRLATVGQGKNKDDIIDTLTRSLVLRNKSYRDLVTKYSSLGMSEKTALQKADKASEQLRKLKVRLQELEKALEIKENKALRALRQQNDQIDLNVVQPTESLNTSYNKPPPISDQCSRLQMDGLEHSKSDATCSSERLAEAALTASANLLQVPIRREVAYCGTPPPLVAGGLATSASVPVDSSTTRKRVYATSVSAQAGARGFQHIKSSSDKGSFILTGADGRGGRVTVLKPPQHMGIRTSTCQRQVKRCRQTPAKGKKTKEAGGLHIDHFFERAE